MDFTKIRFEVVDRIAVITLNSPKNLNAFDSAMVSDLLKAIELCIEDDNIKTVMINGEGKAFSAGGDLGYMYKSFQSGPVDISAEVIGLGDLALKIKKMPKPVIASVKGAVAGAGLGLALCCDFCIAAENATFIQAFANIGLVSDTAGIYFLSKAVGPNKAAYLSFTGKPIDVNTASQLGFVAEIYTMDEFEEKSLKFAKRISQGPGLAYANVKKLMFESQFKDLESYLAVESEAQIECSKSDELIEGVSAFVEKRKSNFK